MLSASEDIKQKQNERKNLKKFFKVEDVPPVDLMYLVFTHMPGESYRRWLRSFLLYLRYVFWVLINSLVCWFR